MLVTGASGTGKTFQVKKSLPECKRLHVSLFGIRTVDQVHDEVIAAGFPISSQAHDHARYLSRLVAKFGSGLHVVSGVPDLLKAVLRRNLKPDRTLVFDDLERRGLETKDLLGVINFYVEQKGFRVVVIAHDEKLTDEFQEMKEKIFGQVLRVEPAIDSAFDTFLKDIEDEAGRAFFKEHSKIVLSEFRQSRVDSLRILRHLLEDLERLHGALEQRHLDNKSAVSRLVFEFAAFNIAVRIGTLAERSLSNQEEFYPRFGPITKFKKSRSEEKPHEERNYDPRVWSQFFDEELRSAMFIHGRYDPDEICASLDRSLGFRPSPERPPWEVLRDFDQYDDKEIKDAMCRMESRCWRRGRVG